MTRNRTTRICVPYVGDSVGGAQVSGITLVQNLDPDRYSPIVVLHELGPLADYLQRRQIPFRHLPLPRYVGTSPSPLGRLADLAASLVPLIRFLHREGVDIVHAHDQRMNTTWTLPTRIAGRCFVWHQRSRFLPSRLPRAMIRFADAIVCNSCFVQSTSPQDLDVHVVLNPFDFETYDVDYSASRKVILSKIDAAEEARLVGFVGRMVEVKRPLLFVEIARHIVDIFDGPVSFVMVGHAEPTMGEAIRTRADELGMATALTIVGSQDPVAPWIAGLDVLVAPATGDAFGRTVVEAMLARTPVVASNSGGHCEIVDDETTGMLAPDGDAIAFARRVVDLLKDEPRAARMSLQAYDAAKKYSIRNHVGQLEDIYDALVSRRNWRA